jgi:Na+/melibiose symporter-like transporter
VFGLATQLYALAFGGDLAILGWITILIAVWDVINDVMVGKLMDAEFLTGAWFPAEEWGRRAPWMVTHLPVLAISMFLLMIPPESLFGTAGLYVWFGFMLFVAKWCYTATLTAFQAVSVELFPFKEERFVIEAWTVPWAWLGAISAVLVVSNAIGKGSSTKEECGESGEANAAFRYAGGAVSLVITFLSMLSVKYLKMAKKRAEKDKVGSFGDFLKDISTNKAVLILIFFRLLRIWSGVGTGLYLLYLRFVAEESKERVASFGLIVPVIGMIVQIFFAVFWGWYFAKTKQNPRWYSIIGEIGSGVSNFIILQASSSALAFVVAFAVDRVWTSPVTFFNTAARGWVIDEDCLAMPGRRREAMFLGMLHLVDNGAGVLATITVAAAAWFGLDTTSCWGAPQEQGGVDYVQAIFVYVVPSIHILNAFFIWWFPIHGERLAALERAQQDDLDGQPEKKLKRRGSLIADSPLKERRRSSLIAMSPRS